VTLKLAVSRSRPSVPYGANLFNLIVTMQPLELWTLHLLDTLPMGQFVRCLVISPTGHFVYWTVCLLDIARTT